MWGGCFMSKWVAMWVRRQMSGLGQPSQHDVTCDTEQVVFSATDNTVWHWYIQDHEVENWPLFNFIRSIWGIYNNKIIEQMCNQTSLEHIIQYAHYIGLLRMLYNNAVAKRARITLTTAGLNTALGAQKSGCDAILSPCQHTYELHRWLIGYSRVPRIGVVSYLCTAKRRQACSSKN